MYVSILFFRHQIEKTHGLYFYLKSHALIIHNTPLKNTMLQKNPVQSLNWFIEYNLLLLF